MHLGMRNPCTRWTMRFRAEYACLFIKFHALPFCLQCIKMRRIAIWHLWYVYIFFLFAELIDWWKRPHHGQIWLKSCCHTINASHGLGLLLTQRGQGRCFAGGRCVGLWSWQWNLRRNLECLCDRADTAKCTDSVPRSLDSWHFPNVNSESLKVFAFPSNSFRYLTARYFK